MSKTKKEPRTAVWVDPTAYVKDEGYRVSVVTENEPGHHPTGDWPYKGGVGQTRPWFWGPTLAEAEEQCRQFNLRMGVSAEEARKIVDSTIRAQNLGRGRRRKAGS